MRKISFIFLIFFGLIQAQNSINSIDFELINNTDTDALRNKFINDIENISTEEVFYLMAGENVALMKNDSLKDQLNQSFNLIDDKMLKLLAENAGFMLLIKDQLEHKSTSLGYNVLLSKILKNGNEAEILKELNISNKEIIKQRIQRIIDANMYFGKGTSENPYITFDSMFFKDYFEELKSNQAIENDPYNDKLDFVKYVDESGQEQTLYYQVIGPQRIYMVLEN